MPTPLAKALVRPAHLDLVAMLTPELGLDAARQVSSHAIQVIHGDPRADWPATFRGMLLICHRRENGRGPWLDLATAWKLAAECIEHLELLIAFHEISARHRARFARHAEAVCA